MVESFAHARDESDRLRQARIGLALCATGAAAWVATVGLSVAMAVDRSPTSRLAPLTWSLWGLGSVAQMAGAGILASTQSAKPVRVLASASAVAFGFELLALATNLGLDARQPTMGTRFPMRDVVHGWERYAAWIGLTLMVVAVARVAESSRRWARWLGLSTVAMVVAWILVDDVYSLCGTHGPSAWMVLALRAATPAAVLALCAVAWRKPTATEPEARVPPLLADAVTALPVLFALRAALMIVPRLLPLDWLDLRWQARLLEVSAGDQLLGVLTIAAASALALAQRRSAWGWAALSLVAIGHVVGLTAGGSASDVVPRLADASLSIVGAVGREPGSVWLDPAALSHLAGIAGTTTALLALASLGESVEELDAARRVREAIAPLVVAAAATLPLPLDPSPQGGLRALVAAGFCAIATFRLLPACVAIARALPRERARLLEAAPATADGLGPGPADADPQEAIEAQRVFAGAVTGTVPANLYAAPASAPSSPRGRLGSPKLAAWRRDVRSAIPWVLAPPILCGLVTNGLAVLGGLTGAHAATAAGYVESAGRIAFSLGLLVAAIRVVAHALTLRGVFVATRPPRLRLPVVGTVLPRAARATMSVALAVHVAFTLLAVAYGIEGALDLSPWLLAADQVAYATVALYGARLLAAGQRSAHALLLTALSVGLGVLTVVCFLALQGPHGFLRAGQIDAWASPIVAALATLGAVAMRAMLRDAPSAPMHPHAGGSENHGVRGLTG